MADERSSMRGERELAAFTAECQRKLDLNAYKGTWKDENPWWLLDRIEEEIEELAAELSKLRRNVESIRSECCDIANFALMVADVAGGLEATYKEEIER